MHWLFEPGFFSSGPVHVALTLSGVVAVVSGVAGLFTVMRGQSFAGHALTDVATTGGAGTVLVGASPVAGFVGAGVLGALAMETIGVQRLRGRDLATGIVLGAATGLSALFLYLDSTSSANSGTTQRVLFGSIFTIAPGTVPVAAALAGATVIALGVMYRPLLLASFSPEMAVGRGVPVRLVGAAFMVAMAMAVGLSSLAIGSILSTAMLIGPAATALRLTSRLGSALAAACAIGLVGAWLGILLAYDSADWGAGHRGLPVSFFIVAVYFVLYLVSGLVPAARRPRRGT